MDIERMHEMVESLTEYSKKMVDCGTSDGGAVDIAPLSELVDMIKDLSESMYHRVLTETMLDSDTEEIMDMFDRYGEDRRYYDNYRYKTSGRFAPKGKGSYMPRRGFEEPPYYHMMPYEMSVGDYKEHSPEYWRDVDRANGKLYYTETGDMGSKNTNTPNSDIRNAESRYDKAKRMYTETKEMHKENTPENKQTKMKSLESYAKELTEDVMGVVEDMTAEERALLKNKVQVLAQKL